MLDLNLTSLESKILLDGAVAAGPDAYVAVVKKVLCSVEEWLADCVDAAEDCDAESARNACLLVESVVRHFAKAQQKPAFYNHEGIVALRNGLFGRSHDNGQCSLATLAKVAVHCGLARTWDFNCHALQGALITMRFTELAPASSDQMAEIVTY
jgi:hypothetical protein